MTKKAVFILFYDKPTPRQNLLARALEKRGYDISFIAWNRKGGSAESCAQAMDGRKVKWVNVKAPTWSAKIIFALFGYYRGVLRALEETGDQADVVFITHIAILPLALLIRRSKKVYDSAELYAFGVSLYFGRMAWLARGFISVAEGALVKLVDGVTVVDTKDGELARHFSRWNGNVQVIWNTPDKADDPDGAKILALRKEIYEGRKTVSFVGGLMREKGLRVALEAASEVKKRHPDALFVFIGPMKDDAAEINRLIESLGVGENVLFFGFMPYRDMLAHIKNAQAGLALFQPVLHYGRISSGGPRRFFTYMQAGTPVIGPMFSEAGKILTESDCGLLVDTCDPEAVAGTITRLFDNPAEARRLGENGRRAFETRYNWEIEEPRFLRFLDRIYGL
jgi:glycosyltransferase involved in cell wall biosynthesis